MHPNCRRGSLPNIRGSRLSAVPFCISILTSVRRIIKIAVRFLHTKTALCDRKDTQSRFAVNAARSIVCVETRHAPPAPQTFWVSMPHAALCVSRRTRNAFVSSSPHCFNAARSIVCVETVVAESIKFSKRVSMPHAALCVSRRSRPDFLVGGMMVSMPHAALCVSRPEEIDFDPKVVYVFQCRTQHCVCRDAVSRSPCPARAEKAFWKDALFCAVFGVCG